MENESIMALGYSVRPYDVIAMIFYPYAAFKQDPAGRRGFTSKTRQPYVPPYFTSGDRKPCQLWNCGWTIWTSGAESRAHADAACGPVTYCLQSAVICHRYQALLNNGASSGRPADLRRPYGYIAYLRLEGPVGFQRMERYFPTAQRYRPSISISQERDLATARGKAARRDPVTAGT